MILVNFEKFPQLIDAMGGIDYTGGCVVSRINGGFRNGGFTLRLKAGTTHIDGRQALALSRTRTNECNPRENDLTRERRQQKVIAEMRSRVLSPSRVHPLAVHRLARAADDHERHGRRGPLRPVRDDRDVGERDAAGPQARPARRHCPTAARA